MANKKPNESPGNHSADSFSYKTIYRLSDLPSGDLGEHTRIKALTLPTGEYSIYGELHADVGAPFVGKFSIDKPIIMDESFVLDCDNDPPIPRNFGKIVGITKEGADVIVDTKVHGKDKLNELKIGASLEVQEETIVTLEKIPEEKKVPTNCIREILLRFFR